MTQPIILQYLKDIKENTLRIEQKMDTHDTRIKSLEDTRTSQRGMMLGGGAVVTFFAGISAWVVDHWIK